MVINVKRALFSFYSGLEISFWLACDLKPASMKHEPLPIDSVKLGEKVSRYLKKVSVGSLANEIRG